LSQEEAKNGPDSGRKTEPPVKEGENDDSLEAKRGERATTIPEDAKPQNKLIGV